MRRADRAGARRADAGISLVEVVCAMTILSLGALMSFSLTVSTLQLEVENRETAAATATARHLVEDLSASDFVFAI